MHDVPAAPEPQARRVAGQGVGHRFPRHQGPPSRRLAWSQWSLVELPPQGRTQAVRSHDEVEVEGLESGAGIRGQAHPPGSLRHARDGPAHEKADPRPGPYGIEEQCLQIRPVDHVIGRAEGLPRRRAEGDPTDPAATFQGAHFDARRLASRPAQGRRQPQAGRREAADPGTDDSNLEGRSLGGRSGRHGGRAPP